MALNMERKAGRAKFHQKTKRSQAEARHGRNECVLAFAGRNSYARTSRLSLHCAVERVA